MNVSTLRFILPVLALPGLLFTAQAADDATLRERLKVASELELEELSAEVETMALRFDDRAVAELLDALAVAWYRHERYPEALALLERVLEGRPESASLAYVKIAEIHRERGDEAKEVEALLASVRHPKLDTLHHIMDADLVVWERGNGLRSSTTDGHRSL